MSITKIVIQNLIILSLFLLITCSSINTKQDGVASQKSLIEISDLYAAGHQQLTAVLNSRPAMGKMLDSSLSATLLVTLVIEYDDGEKERVQQTGCFIDSGQYILTAGHGFFVDSGKLIGLEAQTISRQRLDLNVVALGYSKDDYSNEDWAILQPVMPHRTKGIDLSQGSYAGRDAYLLGYPGGMGLNDSNQVIHALEVEEGSAYPLALICERSLTRPNILVPQVGAIPIRGMSGAPILSEDGELVGLFSSISRTRGMKGWHYIFHMSDLPSKTLDSLSTQQPNK